ncbi:MAG: hypothetical protein ACYDEP_02065 [Acidimicrobiales bacterium]
MSSDEGQFTGIQLVNDSHATNLVECMNNDVVTAKSRPTAPR